MIRTVNQAAPGSPFRGGWRALMLIALAVAGCARAEPAFLLADILHAEAPSATGEVPPDPEVGPRFGEHVEVQPPPFSEGVFPCTDCHDPDIPVKGKPRKLKRAHQEIELRHDAENRWCLDCHDETNFDQLHLANGEGVPFEESYRLCGQCHGDKYRDWRAGIHGRRTGRWDGEKTYLLCVNCHYSHDPAFQPLEPKPAPKAPERTR